MSNTLGEVYEIHEPYYTMLKGKHPDAEVYYMPDVDTNRAWYLAKVSETRYSYIYFGDNTPVVSVPSSRETWNRMIRLSYLAVNNGALPYAHRN